MAKWKAPEDCTGINVGGEQYNVGDDGCIDLPDEGDYAQLLAPHGFEPFTPKRGADKAAKADKTAA